MVDKDFIKGTYKGYGYIALAWKRGLMKMVNGYVRLPEDHPELEKLNHRKWWDIGFLAWKLKKMQAKREGKPFSEPKPKSRRRYKFTYEDVHVDVHGGLTFGEKVTKKNKNQFAAPFEEGWWIGWDYAHLGDCFWDHDNPKLDELNLEVANHKNPFFARDKHCTLEEVVEECKDVIDQLVGDAK